MSLSYNLPTFYVIRSKDRGCFSKTEVVSIVDDNMINRNMRGDV